jgi:hypothetical protein
MNHHTLHSLPNVDSIKQVVEALDQNLSPQRINKTRAYESKQRFQVSWATKLPWVSCMWGLMVLCTL